ncbi:FAD-dependent monooxygenase [Phytoactinopolyspora mesophila]|uniref:Oxidoreductase n=1 Tax=Phytoactinopolyspora mesophila TaxID=2650750 RepID=A0A7K3M0Q7_9ACTN|nr:FAD-dependent monooxygenase [Phytoactinopolyspora mesophila]NDL56876.1 oxidoreductase [Phytoactinopolyspora mesophila]
MDADVIVVGAGPVGLLLAGELRLGGAEVTVVERLTTPMTESRASTLHARSMEILEQRGLFDGLETPPNLPAGHFGGIRLDLSQQPSRFPGQWKLAQADLERLLADWARGMGTRILRGYDVRTVTSSEDAVEIGVHTARGPKRLRAAHVVGCDGDQSSVRRLASFDFPGLPATRELFRCDLTGVDIPDRRFERFEDGLAIAATRDGVTRVMVHEFGRWPVRRTSAPEFTEVASAWKRVTGEDITGGAATWVDAFDNASRQVSRYQQGRMLLAGDAAHRQMPVGGMPLNVGLQDAMNLGWKLAAVVQGWAPVGLLGTYDAERRPAGRQALHMIDAQAHLLLGGPEVDAVRAVLTRLIELPAVRDELAAMVGGLDVRYEQGDRLDGARLPYAVLETASRSTTTTELLRAGRGVLLDLSGDQTRGDGLEQLIQDVPGAVKTERATVPDGSPLAGIDTILVRPDGHVAWTGDCDSDPTAALCRWFGAVKEGRYSPARSGSAHDT